MGFPAELEQVHLLLKSNPSFARVCGFAPKEKDKPNRYRYRQVPSLRKLEQFDQVMRQAGLSGSDQGFRGQDQSPNRCHRKRKRAGWRYDPLPRLFRF